MGKEKEKEYPADFRCPISMEVMKDPVTICTGITYERKNIHKWFFTYKKKTCPATMQSIHSFDVTPNHTLKRLIQARWWLKQLNDNNINHHHHSPSLISTPSINNNIHVHLHDELVSLLTTLESSPFKATCLKKLRSVIETNEKAEADFIRSGGVELVVQVLVQIIGGQRFCTDLVIYFRACEEALAILHQLLLSHDVPESGHRQQDKNNYKTTTLLLLEILSKPESMRSIAIVLERGSAEARLYAVTIFQKMAKIDYNWNFLIQDHQGGWGADFFKSLLELVSDEICMRTKASSCALEVLIEILTMSSSKKSSRLRAIEAGAICVLVELLPDYSISLSRSKCEKILLLIKLLCECPEGRQALVEHSMGIPAVSKTLMRVSNTATKVVVKILWLISSFHPTQRVLEEMLICGSVKKLLTLLHMDDRSSTKDKVLKIFKLHANSWRRYPCFPCEVKEYLGFLNLTC